MVCSYCGIQNSRIIIILHIRIFIKERVIFDYHPIYSSAMKLAKLKGKED